ncbi:type III-B CRISPR module-associated protein Cmr5 [Methanosarcina sp. DH1]|uniref:type III-B CRISPR module-associated protein Cmr5 n=1 Tax=Methanosarcina sp. DH1 TaxID=2605695 RepID=UPI001E29B713|nr:type III-B CRISPR module-associated protein Cmr5 [Methanosarcina sp. DH1]MCC4766892.1 type III-B CRISPR module-associated protein Cmr5 [Methanosarcina sp. DH1]
MIVDKNLDHGRAEYAYACIEEIEHIKEIKGIKDKGVEIEKRYHSAVRSSGALIQKSGLMQTLSFYISKTKDEEDGCENKGYTHYELLAKHILTWILDNNGNEEPLKLYRSLLDYTDEEIIQKTQESKALILWLKRFADAMLISGDNNVA